LDIKNTETRFIGDTITSFWITRFQSCLSQGKLSMWMAIDIGGCGVDMLLKGCTATGVSYATARHPTMAAV
jgi:hypothetical protein